MLESNQRSLYRIVKEVFTYALEEKYDLKLFYNAFMKSPICQKLFKYFSTHYYNSYNVFLEVIETNDIGKKENEYKDDFVSYIAYIYSSFYFQTNEEPRKILEYLPFDYLLKNVDRFHIQDDESAIFTAKEDFNLRNNPMRKVRSRKNKDLTSLNEKELLFVGKEIYLNLFNYPDIKNLSYYFDGYPFCISDDTFFTSSIVSSGDEITALIKNEKYRNNKIKKNKSIMFCLFIEGENKLDKIDFSNIVKTNNKTEAPFNEIVVASNRYCVFINSETAKKYYFVFNDKDYKKVMEMFKNRFH